MVTDESILQKKKKKKQHQRLQRGQLLETHASQTQRTAISLQFRAQKAEEMPNAEYYGVIKASIGF